MTTSPGLEKCTMQVTPTVMQTTEKATEAQLRLHARAQQCQVRGARRQGGWRSGHWETC
jgi:hypothetical protein